MASFQDSPPTHVPPPPPPAPVLSLPIVDKDQWFDPSKLPKKPVKPWKEYKLKTDFEIGNPLGQGAFGYVYLARTPRTNFYVALKVVHAKQVVDAGLEEQIRREQDVHMDLDHPNVIKMYGYFRDDDKIVCVLEYAPGGNVYDEMIKEKDKRFSDARAASYILQVTGALQYLHGQNIVHRDIKPENLLIGYKGEIKMADFGWSVKRGLRSRLMGNKTLCGTPGYMPPEMLNEQAYDQKVDLWCLGVLAYEFLVGKPPFPMDNQRRTWDLICCGYVKEWPMSAEAKDLISGLLQVDPKLRLKLHNVRKHPWIINNTSNPSEQLKAGYLPMFQPYLHTLPELKKRFDEASKLVKKNNQAK